MCWHIKFGEGETTTTLIVAATCEQQAFGAAHHGICLELGNLKEIEM